MSLSLIKKDSTIRTLFKTCNGFTLLEVLIAVTLLTIVLSAIYSTFLLTHKAIKGMDDYLLKLEETRKALDILKRELDATFYRTNDAYTLLKIKDKDIYGKQTSQLIFTTFSSLRPGITKISYFVEEKDGKLILFKKMESPYNNEKSDEFDIMEDIEGFTVEARYNDRWVRTWDTDINRGVPSEIKISFSIISKEREITIFDISKPKVGKSI